MTLYDKIAGLEADVESYTLQPLKHKVAGGYTRHTTGVKFMGRGLVGIGEDVTYGDEEQLDFQKHGLALKFEKNYTIDEFSNSLDEEALFNIALKPMQSAFINYRRWAFESAILDLALKQAKTNLATVLQIKPKPVNFVVSIRLDSKTGLKPLKRLLRINPDLRFKLDPLLEWSNDFIAELAALSVVDVLDLKGYYKGTSVDAIADPELYKKMVEIFPRAIIEDPEINSRTLSIIRPQADRVSWDYLVHSVDDIKKMPLKVNYLNIKPSRFGSIKALFDTYDYCRMHNISMYGGGQFEIGPGRRQIQYLAGMFHPGAPNDVAPKIYNFQAIPSNPPRAPLIVNKF